MSLLESLLETGWNSLSEFAGVPAVTDGGDSLIVVIEDETALPDPYDTANAKLPVYARVSTKAAYLSLNTARNVKRIVCGDGREFKVLEFLEKSELPAVLEWRCEAKRT